MIFSIIFSKSTKYVFSSYILCKYMRTPFSHVCFKYQLSEQSQALIVEATEGQVQAQGYNNWLKHNKILDEVSIEVGELCRPLLFDFIITSLRKSYGFWSLFSIFLLDNFGIKLKKGIDGNKRFICSEHVYKILSFSTFEKFKTKESQDTIDPLEIYQHITKKRLYK